jgi:hypothetical protein
MDIDRPCGSTAAAHKRPVALGQVAEHVALFVAQVALHRCVNAKPGADRLY